MLERGDPNYVSPEGIKWWLDKTVTRYAQKEDSQGRKLWYVEFPDGEKQFVLLDDDEPVHETTSYEAMGAHIDMLKVYKSFAEQEATCSE